MERPTAARKCWCVPPLPTPRGDGTLPKPVRQCPLAGLVAELLRDSRRIGGLGEES